MVLTQNYLKAENNNGSNFETGCLTLIYTLKFVNTVSLYDYMK